MRDHLRLSRLFSLVAMALALSACGDLSDFDDSLDTDTKLLGGTDATAPDWAVAIFKNGKFKCGGTLVGERWVLTAAQCINAGDISQYDVCVGKSRLSRCDAGNMIRAKGRKLHQGWDSSDPRGGNDIGLLRLKDRITGVPFAQLAQQSDEPMSGVRVKVIGWGRTSYGEGSDNRPNRIQKLKLPFLSTADCSQQMNISDRIVCMETRGEEGEVARKSICGGDRGNPLLLNGTQLGIASFTSRDRNRRCIAGAPSGFTRVSSYLRWIGRKTGGEVNTGVPFTNEEPPAVEDPAPPVGGEDPIDEPPVVDENLPQVFETEIGCADNKCITVVGKSFVENSSVQVRTLQHDSIIMTYKSGEFDFVDEGDQQVIVVYLRSAFERSLMLENGLRVTVVNEDAGVSSEPAQVGGF